MVGIVFHCILIFVHLYLVAMYTVLLQSTWENEIWMMPASFNTISAYQNHHAQSFLAYCKILPSNDWRQFRSSLILPGFRTIFIERLWQNDLTSTVIATVNLKFFVSTSLKRNKFTFSYINLRRPKASSTPTWSQGGGGGGGSWVNHHSPT